MNEAIEKLLNRTSVRHYIDDYELSLHHKELIIRAAKQAPTWMNGQNYSMILFEGNMKDRLCEMLDEIGQTSNSKLINQSSLFILFCMDYHMYTVDNAVFDFTDEVEPIIISTTDLSLAAENAVIAAESLDLGSCIVGGVRRLAKELIEMFKMPEYMYPLMGLAIGKPSKEKQKPKPRLDDAINVFQAEQFQVKRTAEDINRYFDNLKVYAQHNNYKTSNWLERFETYYGENKYSNDTKKLLKQQKLI
ncbi:nitroreductase family protein [Mammaliicoccus lentus]|uniref:nitroreductase family protein n=1 Tax=Mammaliicoccus lentus TaxID=42858 RepID=UPI00214B0679|nr:nitroreductase family protein [Mammaliicoccus lentus]MCR1872017.1 nitroreductase family protein [Mammaliicoccus lentus]